MSNNNNKNMTLKYIGDKVLSKRASEVKDVTSPDIQNIIDKMFEVMTEKKGIGLAAPQIGVSKRILIIKTDNEEFVAINPKITKRSYEFILFTEGCLSIPDKELPILRYQEITIEFLDRHGKKQTVEASGLLSVIFQHEIDHLDGILMTDRYKQQTALHQRLDLIREHMNKTTANGKKRNKPQKEKPSKQNKQTKKKEVSKSDKPNESDKPKKTPTKEQKIDKKNTKVIFMGTGDFAHYILFEILKHIDKKNITVVTQPDKKIGRKKDGIYRTLAPNPVRDFAKKEKMNIYQPQKLDSEAIEHIKTLEPDLIIVASYGKILPKEILDIPKFGALNVHASLLPKLRGASPIQNALLLGLKKTGVTIIVMDEGLDTGDIIAQKATKIQEHEKANELLIRLSKIGAKLLSEKTEDWMLGKIKPKPQDHTQATLCQLIDREDGHIQWLQTTEEIYNRYRALYPWPGIFTYWEEVKNQPTRIKLRAIYPYTRSLNVVQKEMTPGTVFIGHNELCIKTSDGAIIVETLQPECKAVMPVYDFLNGHKTFEGSVLR